MGEKNGVLMNNGEGQAHQTCSFMWTDNHWIISHSKMHLEEMMKDLIEEAERWDWEPKPASLWWTSTYASEKISTRAGQHRTLIRVSRFMVTLSIKQDGRKTAWNKECKMQTRLGGGM